MPATPWTELSMAASTAWQEGFPDPAYDTSLDFFIDFLFETTSFFAVVPDAYTELSITATASTELTAPSTAWTELTG